VTNKSEIKVPTNRYSDFEIWSTIIFIIAMHHIVAGLIQRIDIDHDLRKIMKFIGLILLYFGFLPIFSFSIMKYEQPKFLINQNNKNKFPKMLTNIQTLCKIIIASFPLFIISFVIKQSFHVSNDYIIDFVIFPAIFEELLFRGFILAYLLNMYHENDAIFFSAILFGLWHITNYFAGTLTFGQTISQIIIAYYIGYLNGLLVINYQSIYPVITNHFLFNLTFAFDIYSQEMPWFRLLLAYMVMTVVILFLIDRRNKQQNIFN
jgi:membrane protease YdiL (CAAX protease family)